MTTLGKLEKVDLRTFWNHEAHDFTQWLAKEENIQILSDEIGIQLIEVKPEVLIGGYKVDLVATDEDSGKKVIIENQLEQTDHKHLGQIITYASGYNASIIIWIVKDSREEHQKAIEWLNNHTGAELSFFLIRMELWQIGESPLAPKFNILVEPNDWAKTLQQNQTDDRELTQTKIAQLEFWNEFKAFANQNKTKLRLGRKSRAQHWYNISFGTSEAHIALTINTREEEMACEIYIPKAPSLFAKFMENKVAIDAEFEEGLDWMELDGKLASRIKITKTEASLDNKEEWPSYFEWLQKIAEKLQLVFGKYL